MNRELLTARLIGIFLGELEEHRQALERNLLALELEGTGSSQQEKLESLFRAAHSLKGAARSVNATAIEHVCHRLEQAFQDLRDGIAVITPEAMQNLFASVDSIKSAGEAFAERHRPTPQVLPPPPALPVRSPPSPTPKEPSQPAQRKAVASDRTALSHEHGAVDPGALRVPAAKLDSLLARNNELLLAADRVSQRAAGFDALRSAVASLRSEVWGANSVARAAGADVVAAPARKAAMLDQIRCMELEIERLAEGFERDLTSFHAVSGKLTDEVQRVRMVPFTEACEGLERALRDLARSTGKDAELVIEGHQVELDRGIAQRLRDPLLHLLRNAITHGIELPVERSALGKRAMGRVTISARLRADQVEIEVADDGRGLDLEAVRSAAQARGWPDATDARELARYVFRSGLTTAKTLTEIAGRGVGLDAVRQTMEALHGSIDVSFEAGRGTRFSLRAPLTLGSIPSLLLLAEERSYVLPTSCVERVVSFVPSEITVVDGREMLRTGGKLISMFSLARLLNRGARAVSLRERASAVVINAESRSIALVVDELQAERESVITALPSRIACIRHVSGATLLDRERIALLLNPLELCRTALGSRHHALGELFPKPVEAAARLLVVDDSMTTRTLLKSILERAGYDVATASDGREALAVLDAEKIDLVVSDVQMPNMDGIALTERVRRTRELSRIPIILVTSLSNEADRLRGLEAGAHAYLIKSAFDHQSLLDTIAGVL